MKKKTYQTSAKVFLYAAMPGSWYFAAIPKDLSADIKSDFAGVKRGGWGSLPVFVTLGKTRWKTSVFPDKKSGSYLLPLKSEVRRIERVFEGEAYLFKLEIET